MKTKWMEGFPPGWEPAEATKALLGGVLATTEGVIGLEAALVAQKAETKERLDDLDVRMQKGGSRGDGGGGRLDDGAKDSLFADVETKIAPKFEHEAQSEIDPAGVRFGALVGAIAGGVKIQNQLEPDEQKTLIEGVGAAGGYNLPGVVSGPFIDSVRPLTQVLKAGVQSFVMNGPVVKFPGWDELITAGWRSETGAFHETTASFRKVELSAKMVGTTIPLSIELLEDASNDIGGTSARIEQEIARAMAQAIDLAALFGAGTDAEPLGLATMAASGVGDLNTEVLGSGNGATPGDYDFLLDSLLKGRNSNFEPGSIIWSPRTASTLSKLVTGISGDKTKLKAPDDVVALRKFVTTQIPDTLTVGTSDDCSDAFLGDFSYGIMGFRPEVGIRRLTDPYTGAANGIVKLYAWQRVDFAVLQGQAFTVISGIRG